MTTLGALDLDKLLPATFTAPGLSEAEFLELCDQFPDAMLEYTSDGTVIVLPPTDPETGISANEVCRQLSNWAEQGGGKAMVTGPDAGFYFPDGSRRSPDAAWFDKARWREAKKAHPGKRFPMLAPEFLIEVRSPGDRIKKLREKMEEYIANGVKLAWLIDLHGRTVTIYRPERPPDVLENPATVAGEGPIAGFVLNLERVFEPLG